MSLTMERLKECHITDGACTKILLNIKKLKEREQSLKQCLVDIDNEEKDLSMIVQQLNEVMLTPIRPKQFDDDDLPKYILLVLEKGQSPFVRSSPPSSFPRVSSLSTHNSKHGR